MDDLIDRLLDASSWQDSLLQSYRSLHLTIQSILLATSAGLFIAIVTIEDFYGSLASFFVIILMFVFQHFITKKFKEIILYRGEDVNFWHREIIIAEQDLPTSLRYFTKFKIYQKLQRENSDFLQEKFLSTKKINKDDIELLIEKGLGHTRQAIDRELFSRITKIWSVFTISGGLFILYRI